MIDGEWLHAGDHGRGGEGRCACGQQVRRWYWKESSGALWCYWCAIIEHNAPLPAPDPDRRGPEAVG
jgi:hypothetical protein